MRQTKITIRKRTISGGRESVYLDYYPAIRNPYTMKMFRHEYIGIYLWSRPKTEIRKNYNAEMQQMAEAIRAKRITSLMNEELGFFDSEKLKGDFLDYFKQTAMKQDNKWLIVHKHFSTFTKHKCTFGEVDVPLANRFKEYLLTSNRSNSQHHKISQNSASSYFCTFRALLKRAHQEGLLKTNLNDHIEGVELKETRKEYLTLDEVKQLASTPCKRQVVKNASLFACLTGLRISDIINLDWQDIQPASEGGWCMRIRTEKTETETTLPISDEALEWCGDRTKGKVFKGMEKGMSHYQLRQWLTDAGITKHITFHLARHTFATLQIALGTDIYTVSKMLTHKNVATTQIYADLVNAKKWESANRISLK